MEWPAYCTYWKRQDVEDLIVKHNLKEVIFHGCALGLHSIRKAHTHKLLMKPWKIMTNSEAIIHCFSRFTCPGVSKEHIHAPCRGVDAKASEGYTDLFAKTLHTAVQMHFNT